MKAINTAAATHPAEASSNFYSSKRAVQHRADSGGCGRIVRGQWRGLVRERSHHKGKQQVQHSLRHGWRHRILQGLRAGRLGGACKRELKLRLRRGGKADNLRQCSISACLLVEICVKTAFGQVPLRADPQRPCTLAPAAAVAAVAVAVAAARLGVMPLAPLSPAWRHPPASLKR